MNGTSRVLAALAVVLAVGVGTAGDAAVPASGADARPGTAPPAVGQGFGTAPGQFTPGAPGIGDAYFPEYGNGGYDVDHYRLELRYDPGPGQLDGRAVITATATQALSSFNLDFGKLTVRSVAVDGAPATWTTASAQELVVTPAAGLPSGRKFTVDIRYNGVPGVGPDQTAADGGFYRRAGAAVAVGQPESATEWYPVNDHPRDKARYDFAITVPDGLTAVANGVPAGTERAAGWVTWRWKVNDPMVSYLATMAVGRFRVSTGTVAGIPLFTAIEESLPRDVVDPAIARTPEIMEFLAARFGPYPFDATGAIVPNEPRMRFALETQTRPVYSPRFFNRGRDGTAVVAHELAHQWYGDSVSLRDWRDIWLNEGLATYAQWMWEEHDGRDSVAQQFDQAYASSANGSVFNPPPGDPGKERLFGNSVYVRGAMTVHALRRAVGDEAFFAILKTWSAQKRHATATTDEFVALAERVSGKTLRPLFQSWLYESAKPPHPG